VVLSRLQEQDSHHEHSGCFIGLKAELHTVVNALQAAQSEQPDDSASMHCAIASGEDIVRKLESAVADKDMSQGEFISMAYQHHRAINTTASVAIRVRDLLVLRQCTHRLRLANWTYTQSCLGSQWSAAELGLVRFTIADACAHGLLDAASRQELQSRLQCVERLAEIQAQCLQAMCSTYVEAAAALQQAEEAVRSFQQSLDPHPTMVCAAIDALVTAFWRWMHCGSDLAGMSILEMERRWNAWKGTNLRMQQDMHCILAIVGDASEIGSAKNDAAPLAPTEAAAAGGRGDVSSVANSRSGAAATSNSGLGCFTAQRGIFSCDEMLFVARDGERLKEAFSQLVRPALHGRATAAVLAWPGCARSDVRWLAQGLAARLLLGCQSRQGRSRVRVSAELHVFQEGDLIESMSIEDVDTTTADTQPAPWTGEQEVAAAAAAAAAAASAVIEEHQHQRQQQPGTTDTFDSHRLGPAGAMGCLVLPEIFASLRTNGRDACSIVVSGGTIAEARRLQHDRPACASAQAVLRLRVMSEDMSGSLCLCELAHFSTLHRAVAAHDIGPGSSPEEVSQVAEKSLRAAASFTAVRGALEVARQGLPVEEAGGPVSSVATADLGWPRRHCAADLQKCLQTSLKEPGHVGVETTIVCFASPLGQHTEETRGLLQLTQGICAGERALARAQRQGTGALPQMRLQASMRTAPDDEVRLAIDSFGPQHQAVAAAVAAAVEQPSMDSNDEGGFRPRRVLRRRTSGGSSSGLGGWRGVFTAAWSRDRARRLAGCGSSGSCGEDAIRGGGGGEENVHASPTANSFGRESDIFHC